MRVTQGTSGGTAAWNELVEMSPPQPQLGEPARVGGGIRTEEVKQKSEVKEVRAKTTAEMQTANRAITEAKKMKAAAETEKVLADAALSKVCEREPLCFDATFPCDICCTTGQNHNGQGCWEGVYTQKQCCVDGTGSSIAAARATAGTSGEATITARRPGDSPAAATTGLFPAAPTTAAGTTAAGRQAKR